MKPLTREIKAAIAKLKAAGIEVTRDRVKRNVRVASNEWSELADKGFDREVDRVMKAEGQIITDDTPREGGRPRADYWFTTAAEHEAQLRIQRENAAYVTNEMRAHEQAIAFAKEWEKDHGYPPPFIEIADDVDRIYRMNKCVAPSKVRAA